MPSPSPSSDWPSWATSSSLHTQHDVLCYGRSLCQFGTAVLAMFPNRILCSSSLAKPERLQQLKHQCITSIILLLHPKHIPVPENELSPSWNQKKIRSLMFNFSGPAIQGKLWHVVRKVLLGGNLLVLYQYISPIVPSLVPCIICFCRRFWLDSLSMIL